MTVWPFVSKVLVYEGQGCRKWMDGVGNGPPSFWNWFLKISVDVILGRPFYCLPTQIIIASYATEGCSGISSLFGLLRTSLIKNVEIFFTQNIITVIGDQFVGFIPFWRVFFPLLCQNFYEKPELLCFKQIAVQIMKLHSYLVKTF